MKKKLSLLILIFSILTPGGYAVNEDAGSTASPERIILNPARIPSTEQAVTWRSKVRLDHPVVQLAPARSGVDLEDYAREIPATGEEVAIPTNQHAWHYSAVMKRLSPGTTYYYRVGSEDNWSEWISFHTAKKSFSPFSFVYMGDPQVGLTTYCPRIFRQAVKSAPDAKFWLFCGDQVNVGNSDQEFGEFFDAGSWMFSSINIIPVVGNHEYPRNSLLATRQLTPLWKPHYTLPENGPAGLEETVYWLDYQGVRIIILNGSEKLEEQRDWLARLLRKNPARWTVVGIHQPLYSTGSDRDNPELQKLFLPIFDQNRVDLVLQGHDHTYGRTYPLKGGHIAAGGEKGTVYVVSSSGAKFYEQNPRYLNLMAKTTLDTQLFQVIEVGENTLHFRAETANGDVVDEFTLTK